ncbi:MAG: hypothetical protein C0511_15520 [Hyphomicrobium sp.]|nr:hypothetical protein [Hyphomicrobium sp.]
MKNYIFLFTCAFHFILLPAIALADCTGPAGVAGAREYFAGDNTYKLCNGTDWIDFAIDGTLGACSSVGTTDYDATESAYKFCDGATWQKVACASGAGCCPDLGPCSAAGTIDYFSVEQALAYCDGASWVSMTPDPQAPSSAGMIGHWKFDEGTGVTASDASGNGNTGTLTNFGLGAWGTGIKGGALNFDGVNDVVNAGSAAMLDNLTTLTACAWVRRPGTRGGVYSSLLDKSTTGLNGWNLYMRDDGAETGFYNRVGYYSYFTNGSLVPLNTWFHFCATTDSSVTPENVKLYIDGNLIASADGDAGTGVQNDAANSLLIGDATVAPNPSIETFQGWLDEVRLYNRILTQAEIAQISSFENCGN